MNPASLVLILGVAHANPQDSGIWYIQDQPHKLHQDGFTYGAGIEIPDWRISVQSLGKTGTDSYVVDGGFQGYFHTTGKEWGVSALRRFGLGYGIQGEAGIWVYHSSVWDRGYVSGGWGIAPQAGLQYKSVAVTIRGAENRSTDQNGNHQPSPIKGFVTTLEWRF